MEPTQSQPTIPAGSNPAPELAMSEPPQSPATMAAGTSSMPVIADDADLIEPEWVAAVKQTLEQYQQDPYSLAQAMTQLREDYLTKRYGRHIEPSQ